MINHDYISHFSSISSQSKIKYTKKKTYPHKLFVTHKTTKKQHQIK